MKKNNLMPALVILIVSLLYSSCNNKEEVYLQKVTFSFENKSLANVSGLRKVATTEKTDARYLLITVENEKGEKIYDTKKIELYQFNGSFVSDPISLDVSDKQYKLTQFLVLDADNNAIYCTPLEKSSSAYLVTNSLPIFFSVNKNKITEIIPEVIPVSSVNPSDYGYSIFDFNIIETINLKTCVQIMDTITNSRKLTNAEISITCNDTIVQYFDSINAVISTLIVKDGYADYTITASKRGYETQRIKLSKAEIKTYSGNPLILYLPQRKTQYSSMAMVVTQIGTTLKYQFKLGTQYITDLTINSASIYDLDGNLKMSVNAGIDQTFSIASLTSGHYLLKVDVANSVLFGKVFFK